MATRPAVLVFQEFATLTQTPNTPELNCLIAGPAYWLKDFPNDKTDILLSSSYGTLNAPATGTSAAPAAGVAAISVSDAPANKVGAVLDTASVKVFLGSVRVETYNQLAATASKDPALATQLLTLSGDQSARIKVGDSAVLSGVTKPAVVKAVALVAGNSVLTLDSDVADGAYAVRIERAVSSDVQVASSFVVTTAGSNAIAVKGGIAVDGFLVVYAEVYVAYRALRTDLADVATVSTLTELTSLVGPVDARNPLAVGASIALANTATPVQVFGVSSDDRAGYTAMQDAISGRKDIYAVVPLTANLQVLEALKSEFESMADPVFAQDNGVPQKFRIVIGSADGLPTEKIVQDLSATGASATVAGTSPNVDNVLTFSNPGFDLVALGVVPGSLVVADLIAAGNDQTYTVAQVLSATELVVMPTTVPPATTAAVVVALKTATGVAIAPPAAVDVTVSTSEDLYLELSDTNATFIVNGVMPGDFVAVGATRFEVASVVSNQRLRIVNNGANTNLAELELPHGVTRTSPVALVGAISYSVVRTLTKDGQIDALLAIAQSLKSKRAVLCWPESVLVADLVDGGLPRAGGISSAVRAAATAQPGYYLACAVGGLVAGLPPQHGFTNLGIGGVSKLYHANTYFSDTQMSKLSNGGWFAFQQDTASSLPYVIHQLTTKPDTVELGELSMVKNFDFVSLFFSDILNDFIGTWNINKETLAFVKSAIQTGIENLRLRKQPKIGAPINSATITDLKQSTVSTDRLEIYVEVSFPRPLNTIALHLVSI